MELKKATKIYQKINKIANTCKDTERQEKFKDFAEKFRCEFIEPKQEQ